MYTGGIVSTSWSCTHVALLIPFRPVKYFFITVRVFPWSRLRSATMFLRMGVYKGEEYSGYPPRSIASHWYGATDISYFWSPIILYEGNNTNHSALVTLFWNLVVSPSPWAHAEPGRTSCVRMARRYSVLRPGRWKSRTGVNGLRERSSIVLVYGELGS